MLDKLIAAAQKARLQSLSPYSKFAVGAALQTTSGKIYGGCNIESSSYGLTMCAERVALFKALSEGERHFSHLAVTAATREFTTPCGACRQLLWDYARDVQVTLINELGETRTVPLRELLPEAFDEHFLIPKSG
jgi:cytidine deaminase